MAYHKDNLDDILSSLSSQMQDVKNLRPHERGTCAQCGKPIVGDMVEAGGRKFHPEHMSCSSCYRPIGSGSYYEPDGKIQCESCFKKTMSRCAKCNELIHDRVVHAIGKTWHPHHLACQVCNTNLEKRDFFVHDEMPYCPDDYNHKFGKSCAKCDRKINDEVVTALHREYHVACFVCEHAGCGTPLSGKPFYDVEGQPYCERHHNTSTGLVCAKCGQAIGGGKYAAALDRKWHAECFTCAYCSRSLMGESFSDNNGKYYCPECDAKLFG